MPNRVLRDAILTSERVDQLDAAAEVFYRRLMSVVDDFGRFDARPKVLRSQCYPLKAGEVREADISRWMAACLKAGLIVLYEVAGKPYGVLLNLGKPRADRSRFPDPPHGFDSRDSTDMCAHVRADENTCAHLRPNADTRADTRAEECCEPGSADSPPPSFPFFPCVKGRKSSGRRWELTAGQVQEWAKVFPGVNVRAECLKAHAWVMANPAKRKTSDGMPDFLRRWLARAQNESGRKRANGAHEDANPDFVRKEWTEAELDDFFARMPPTKESDA